MKRKEISASKCPKIGKYVLYDLAGYPRGETWRLATAISESLERDLVIYYNNEIMVIDY